VDPPPSANDIWRSSRGRVHRAPKYLAWIESHSLTIPFQGTVLPPVAIHIRLTEGKGWRTNRDLDNIAKPILDLLCQLGLIEDDSTRIVRQISLAALTARVKDQPATVEVRVHTIPTDGENMGGNNGVRYDCQPPPGRTGQDPDETT